jgi:hypothetical protein
LEGTRVGSWLVLGMGRKGGRRLAEWAAYVQGEGRGGVGRVGSGEGGAA